MLEWKSNFYFSSLLILCGINFYFLKYTFHFVYYIIPLYSTEHFVFWMIKGHLEIVCETKFHMSIGKTKFYAVKLACAYTIFILLMLVLM